MDKLNYTKYEVDQLKEIINIGTGNASTALSKMIKQTIQISVPNASIDSLENHLNRIYSGSEISTIVTIKLTGEFEGVLTFCFSLSAAKGLVELMLEKQSIQHYSERDIAELHKSSLEELCNILAGTSMTSLSKFLGITIYESVPEIVTDFTGAIVSSILLDILNGPDNILSFNVSFSAENEDVSGDIVIMFDSKSSIKLLDKAKSLLRKAA